MTPANATLAKVTTPLVCSKAPIAPLFLEPDEEPEPDDAVVPPPAPFVLPCVADGCEGTVVPVGAAAAQDDAAADAAAALEGPVETTVAFPAKEQDEAWRFVSW